MYHRIGNFEPGHLPAWQAFQTIIDWQKGDYGTTPESGLEVLSAYRIGIAAALPDGVDLQRAMLVAIKPGGMIRLHKDIPIKESSRLHFVLETNERCWNLHDGHWQQLAQGGIYGVDQRKEHASVNWGDTTRVHLVVDVVPAAVAVG